MKRAPTKVRIPDEDRTPETFGLVEKLGACQYIWQAFVYAKWARFDKLLAKHRAWLDHLEAQRFRLEAEGYPKDE